jgi:hypothetical protein
MIYIIKDPLSSRFMLDAILERIVMIGYTTVHVSIREEAVTIVIADDKDKRMLIISKNDVGCNKIIYNRSGYKVVTLANMYRAICKYSDKIMATPIDCIVEATDD